MELVKKLESSNILKKILLVIFGTILLTISAKIKVPFYPVPMTINICCSYVVLPLVELGLATILRTCLRLSFCRHSWDWLSIW